VASYSPENWLRAALAVAGAFCGAAIVAIWAWRRMHGKREEESPVGTHEMVRDHRIRRGNITHPAEADYSSTPKQRLECCVFVDIHEFLDYARLRAQIARAVERLYVNSPDTALIGFLRGSIGLAADARRLIEQSSGRDVSFVQGLRHGGHPITVAEEPYHAQLDHFWEAGKRHFILVDEVVGGSQITAAMRSTRKWMAQHERPEARFSIVVAEGQNRGSRTESVPELVSRIASEAKPQLPINAVEPLRAERLLEMDTQGSFFRAIVFGEDVDDYAWTRVVPSGGFHLRCPQLGTTVFRDMSASSVDQSFGQLIRRAMQDNTVSQSQILAEAVSERGCEACKQMLNEAQAAWNPASL